MFKVLYSAYELRRAKLILTNRPIITLFGRIAASDWLAKHIASIVRVACVSGVERGTARERGIWARARGCGAPATQAIVREVHSRPQSRLALLTVGD